MRFLMHCTPRTIPLPLLDKVEQELTKMESQGVISQVNQPTSWCAGMVVPKKSGAIRICVDLKRLNQTLQYPSQTQWCKNFQQS